MTFDLDDTLWDNRPVLLAAETALYEWLDRHYPRLTARYSPEDLRALRESLRERHPELDHDVTRLRKLSLRTAARAVGHDDTLVEAAFAVFIEARHRIVPYSDVPPALRALRNAGYCLGTLSNGNADVWRVGLGEL